MSVTTDLIQIVTRAHSLTRILHAAAGAITQRLDVVHCSVFLLDEQRRLNQNIVYGADPPDPLASVVEAALAAQAAGGKHLLAQTHGDTSFLASPMLLHDHVIGVLVIRGAAHQDISEHAIEAFEDICAQLAGVVDNARIVNALDRGERLVRVGTPPAEALASVMAGEQELRGIGASPGIAIGGAMLRSTSRFSRAAADVQTMATATERARLRTAMQKTNNDLERVQEAASRLVDEEHAFIFTTQLLLLNDPVLLERIDERIDGGAGAAAAIIEALTTFEEQLRLAPDPYIREKCDDIDDLRSRLLAHVLGHDHDTPFGSSVVVTNRIPPSLIVELKSDGAQALATEGGSATSHGALLARAMGIPVVAGVSGLLDAVSIGDRLIVDGSAGVVIVRPTDETVTRYESKRQQAERLHTEHARFYNVLAQTADGVRVTMHANVGTVADLVVARENGAEGVGLYRTEFPFIVRAAFPTRAEQIKIYRAAYASFPGAPIHFRIVDLAGDKFVTTDSVTAARDPFHGYRSLRVLFDHPDVLRTQVQALAIAAGDRPLHILIPMVTSLEDLRRTRGMLDEALADISQQSAQRAPAIGAMIEVPAAVEMAPEIAKEVDFLTIGTNDLIQYTLVVDREDGRMASLGDPCHPAILRMIARVVAAARAAGTTVCVCGEAATQPDIALALIALGVDALSVPPTVIPRLKQALAAARLLPMQRAMDRILNLSEAGAVADMLRKARLA